MTTVICLLTAILVGLILWRLPLIVSEGWLAATSPDLTDGLSDDERRYIGHEM